MARTDQGSTDLTLVFHTGRKALRLSDPEKWRRAIVMRDLERTTVVRLERLGMPSQEDVASEIPELAPLFDELAPLSPKPPVAVAAANPFATARPKLQEAVDARRVTLPTTPDYFKREPAAPESAASVGSGAATPVTPPSPRASPDPIGSIVRTPPPARRREQKRKSGGGPWLILIPAVIGGLLWAGLRTGREAEPASGPAAAVAVWYAIRDANVRSEPSADSAIASGGSLRRGARVEGALVLNASGRGWIRLGDRRYVSGVNLGSAPPPELLTIFDPDVPAMVTETSPLLAAPTETADVIETVRSGVVVYRVGLVPGGFVEIRRRVGGVGYLSADAFDDTRGQGSP